MTAASEAIGEAVSHLRELRPGHRLDDYDRQCLARVLDALGQISQPTGVTMPAAGRDEHPGQPAAAQLRSPREAVSSNCQFGYHDNCRQPDCACPKHAAAAELCWGDARHIEVRGDRR